MRMIVGIIGIIISIVIVAASIPFFDVEDDDDDLYLFVITGQSNAAYYIHNTTVANDLPAPAKGNVFYYGTSGSSMYYGINPSSPTYDTTFESYSIQDITNDQNKFRIGGLESALASKFFNETGKKALIVNTSIGGQSITLMQPGELGYEYAADVIQHAIDLVGPEYNIRPATIFFIQGESDSSMAINDYKAYFGTMASAYMSLTHCGSITLGEVRPVNAPQIAAAQLQICDEDPDVYLGSMASGTFTVDNGLMTNDNLHYSQAGKNIVGTQLMDTYLTAHKSEFIDPVAQYQALIGIIPLLIIIGIVIATIGLLRFKGSIGD